MAIGELWGRLVFAYASMVAISWVGVAALTPRFPWLLALDQACFVGWLVFRLLPLSTNRRLSCIALDLLAVLGSVFAWSTATGDSEIAGAGLLQPAIGWCILCTISLWDLGMQIWEGMKKPKWR